jgi:hypothetical protein
MIMAEDAAKSEGPACACGRGDLYMESLKLKENGQNETVDSSTLNQDKIGNNSVDTSDNAVQKP